MAEIAELPEFLKLPPKLMPIISGLNKYKYFVIEGGRGSGKTQALARILLWLSDVRNVRVVCGRETQANIEESVYTALKDLIFKYTLAYDVLKSRIDNKFSGSQFTFKGFREQGATGIKGLEGVDILWVDEAQALTNETMNVIIPTIRKENSKIFFTMNRHLRDDAAFIKFVGRPDCLHIHIDYFENPYCPLTLKIEAEECKRRSLAEYNHIWLGQPLDRADGYLFDFNALDKAASLQPFGDLFKRQTIIGIDLAASGGDLCVATMLERCSDMHWRVAFQESWTDASTTASVGRIVAMMGKYKPTAAVVDAGGLGLPMYQSIVEAGVKNIFPFNGASTEGITNNAGNCRADGYLLLRDWFENEFLCMNSAETRKELEGIKRIFKSNGKVYIQSKDDMKKEGLHSPDRADSLMMAVWGAVRVIPKVNDMERMAGGGAQIQRVFKRKQTR